MLLRFFLLMAECTAPWLEYLTLQVYESPSSALHIRVQDMSRAVVQLM